MTSLPETHTAILQSPTGAPVITPNVPLPTLSPGDILIRTAAVALNPCDVKTPTNFPHEGHYIGCDVAGTVVAVGSANVTWNIGDRVFGAVPGGNPVDGEAGTMAEYVKLEGVFAMRVPERMGFVEAAGLSPVCMLTMAVVVSRVLGLPGGVGKPAEKSVDVLVYGGSSSVGGLGIQMVKLLGHRCITTCSPGNFELVRSYGADEVFDYRSPTCAADIRRVTRSCLRYAIDPFGEVRTMSICVDAIGRAGGRYIALENFQEEASNRRTVKREFFLGQTFTGKGVALGGVYTSAPDPELGKWSAQCLASLERLVGEGKFVPHPIRLFKGGFEDMVRGLEMLGKREVSAEKLVVSLE